MRRIICHVSIWLLMSCLIVFGHPDASGQSQKRAAPETERAAQKAREHLKRKGVTDEQIKKAKAAWDLNPPQTPKAKGVAIRPAGKFEQFEKQPPKGHIALKGRHEPLKFSLSNPSAKPLAPAENTENKEHIPASHLNTHPHHGHHIHHTHSQPEGVCGSKNSPTPAEKCKLAGEDFNKPKQQN